MWRFFRITHTILLEIRMLQSSNHDWSGCSGLRRSWSIIGDVAPLYKAEKKKGLQVALSGLPAAVEDRQ